MAYIAKRRLVSTAPVLLGGFALVLLLAMHTDAQERGAVPFDPRVVTAVDRVFPGFLEILDCSNSPALTRLARTLKQQSSPEALTVLLWMLQRCPAWDEAVSPLFNVPVARFLTSVPVVELAATLKNVDERQRQQGVILLSERLRQAGASDKAAVENVLIDALADPRESVSSFAASALRGLGTAEASAALERLAANPNISGDLYAQALGRRRSLRPAEIGVDTFSATTLARLEQVFPDALEVLRARDDQAVRKLLSALEKSNDAALTPVLVWLFLHGDTGFGGWFTYRLPSPPYAARLPIPELVAALNAEDPDLRLHVVRLFWELFRRKPPFVGVDRGLVVRALTPLLKDPNAAVRVEAAKALGATGSQASVAALMAAIDTPQWSALEAVSIVEALKAIGMGGGAIPVLERLALRSRLPILRESAATAYVDVAKPADQAAEIRRLLWEQPDTELEELVLQQGRRALPQVWQALTAGSTAERRAAAALLAWYPDPSSIPPILAALDASPGALTRNQLLFDLSVILSSDGTPPDTETQRTLAAAHLQWLFDRLAHDRDSSPERFIDGRKREILIHPDHVPSPFSVELATVTTPRSPAERPQRLAATARLETGEQFAAATHKGADGLVFQVIRAAHGVARVATIFNGGGFGHPISVTLYRSNGKTWTPLEVPDYSGFAWRAASNLVPSFNRNYGPQHPMKVVWLDQAMARVGADFQRRDVLRMVDREVPDRGRELDASYAPLLERYKESDSPAVRYTAAFESARLTGKADMPFWMDALEKEADERFLELAVGAIAQDALRQIDESGREPTGSDRKALVTAALNPDPVNPRLLPRRLPGAEDVQRVRQSGRFALVDVAFGRFDGSGFSMLFDRRGDRWVFLFVTRGWIA